MLQSCLRRAGIASGPLLALLLLLTGAPSHAVLMAGELYGVNSGAGGSFLTRIDPTDASITIIGNTGITVDGLAIFGTSTIYAANNGTGELVTLNPDTGAVASTIGSFGITPSLEGLAIRPSDGVMFGIDLQANQLVTVDRNTGAATAIGGFGGPVSLAGLSFVGSTLYGADFGDGGLYEIDQTTGAATLIGSGASGNAGGPLGLATQPGTGMLYMAEWRGGLNMTLATVSQLDGSRTPVGTMVGAPQIEGLSFVVPEPATLPLVALGCLGLAAVRRRSAKRE